MVTKTIITEEIIYKYRERSAEKSINRQLSRGKLYMNVPQNQKISIDLDCFIYLNFKYVNSYLNFCVQTGKLFENLRDRSRARGELSCQEN